MRTLRGSATRADGRVRETGDARDIMPAHCEVCEDSLALHAGFLFVSRADWIRRAFSETSNETRHSRARGPRRVAPCDAGGLDVDPRVLTTRGG